ncbi:MAG: PTS fructose transporter subunit IIA [Erysipelotrichaceae bacterium]|nr:PTS fructose transporter subunit IIA [Erysipelotrichaceae bacterium]MDY5251586.1 hypothetical protein [Erysipelotrichaceae bacterium]
MKLLIATHGTFAEGIKSALQIIVGNVENIATINAYVDECDLKKELDNYFEINKNEELIVCTDLFGGSVNQAIIQKLKEKEFILVTGVNFPMLLELSLALGNGNPDKEKIRELINNSKEQLMLVNDVLTEKVEDDFDF